MRNPTLLFLIKNVLPINLIVLLLLSHIIYVGISCYVKDWLEEHRYYWKNGLPLKQCFREFPVI